MELSTVIRSSLVALCLLIFMILFIFKTPKAKLNWTIFYSTLWVTFSLAIVNYILVEKNLWCFPSSTPLTINMPLDFFFIWIIFWGIIPVYFFKGKYALILCLTLFWLDLLLMPKLEELGLLQLNKYWLIGEVILILFVWFPSYVWAKIYYKKTHLKFRSLFQVIIMVLFLFITIPFIIKTYNKLAFNIKPVTIYLFQFVFIIALPSLIAVIDLTTKGKGTPFPYDKTSILVKNGVYAYCKNPIQWSFTFLFIPLSYYYNSPLLLLGIVISIAYTIGVSNYQEYNDMKIRFGIDWINYKRNVPSWRFLWKPKAIPKGTIYFKKNCNQCEQIKSWFTKNNTQNLDIKFSNTYTHTTLLQVTYIDYLGKEYKSVKAIAHALEHINLAYASLGWFMRLPLINTVLQYIIDTMSFNEKEEQCIFNETNHD